MRTTLNPRLFHAMHAPTSLIRASPVAQRIKGMHGSVASADDLARTLVGARGESNDPRLTVSRHVTHPAVELRDCSSAGLARFVAIQQRRVGQSELALLSLERAARGTRSEEVAGLEDYGIPMLKEEDFLDRGRDRRLALSRGLGSMGTTSEEGLG